MKNLTTQDFAVIGISEGNVFLEANEWDISQGFYRTVTLYLSPEYAKNLADQLAVCAVVRI